MLTAGTQLGSHEVLALLGPLPSSERAGGIGEVNRARDTPRDRSGPVKMLGRTF